VTTVNSFKEAFDPVMAQNFTSRPKDELSPARMESVGFSDDFQKLCFEFFLCKLAAGPQVVSDSTLLHESLESRLVLTDTNDARDVCSCAAKKGGFEEAFGSGGI